MKFLVVRSPEALDRARPPVRAFLLFAALLLFAAVAQRAAQGALTPAGVEALLAPAEGERLGSLAVWEAVHAGAFLYGFLLLGLGSLLAVCPLSARLRGTLLAVASGGALADLLAPLIPVAAPGVPGWAALRLAGFVAATLALLASIAVAWISFGRPERRGDA